MLGIVKNDVHSYKDLHLTIKSKKINVANKKKITQSVPFMNGSYDFSLLYGDQCYDDRELEYTFNLQASSKMELGILRRRVTEWLYNGGRQMVIDDEFPTYYFIAECISVDVSESGNYAEIKASFLADPCIYGIHFEGHDIWDDFCFEDDCSQETVFDVEGTNEIEVINLSSILITPTVICSDVMDVILDETPYHFNSGSSKDYRFKLNKGANKMIVRGSGMIEFQFRKEVL